ncbi:MAG: helix-turn-helix domain-containing protein [Isosphaeraceae bacterium]
MSRVSDAAMLRSLMDENGVSQADVFRSTDISNRVVSLVLNGTRDLAREHIAALSTYFEVDPSASAGRA